MLNSQQVKQAILGTFVGKWGINIRNYYDFFYTFYKNPESLGTLVNDQMATFLVTKLCNSNKVFLASSARSPTLYFSIKKHPQNQCGMNCRLGF
jgi:hypothetical protein